MKRKLLKIVLLILISILPMSLKALNSIVYTATYDMNNLTIGTDTLGGVTYTTVTYDGLINKGEPGAPCLPVDYIRFSVPHNATNFTVTALLQNALLFNIPYLVYPCQREDTTAIILPDSAIYFSNAYYPVNNAWVVDEGFLEGENHIVTVAVMPISFKYSKKGAIIMRQLKESDAIKLTLSYELTNSPNLYPLVRKDSTLRQEGYQLTRGFVVNPDSVVAYAPPSSYPPSLAPYVCPPDSSLINTDSIYYDINTAQAATFPYMIVTTPELRHSLRRLAALKRQQGLGVALIPTDFIYNHVVSRNGDHVKMPSGNYEVSDTSNEGKIRQFLKYAYSRFDTRYLLLAGKSVPYREHVITHYGMNNTVSYDTIPTDWYYSDLTSNIKTGQLDFDPELYPGRLLASSSEQINNYTDKLLRYELNPGHGNATYLKKAFFVEGQDFIEYFLGLAKTMNKWLYFDTIRMIEIPGARFPKGSDVINYINSNPVGFTGIFNHGSPERTKVYGSSENNHQNGPQYFIWHHYHENDTSSGLNFLTNKYYPAIFYSPSCETIRYNNHSTTFGESYITGKDYGGPTYIGHTAEVGDDAAKFMGEDFIRYIRDGYLEIGKADAYSKKRRVNDYQDRMTHNLLGDPVLEMWTDTPACYDHISVTRTDDSLMIDGIDVDLTIVAYYSNEGIIGRKTVNHGSLTLTGISPNSSIMVYKHNYIPFIVPMILQNISLSRSQYVIATDVTAGSSVESKRTPGDVIVENGTEYEIEASGTVTLHDGFMVEKGATFAVYPSSF